jgi:hypothetical protein
MDGLRPIGYHGARMITIELWRAMEDYYDEYWAVNGPWTGGDPLDAAPRGEVPESTGPS